MSIDTTPAPAATQPPTPAPLRHQATATWLAGEDPPRLSRAALLHPEVQHPGACYSGRTLQTGLIGLSIAAGADVSYALGRLQDGHPFDALPLGPVWTVVAVLAAAGLFALAALVGHALRHRAEAPYAHNVVHQAPDEGLRAGSRS